MPPETVTDAPPFEELQAACVVLVVKAREVGVVIVIVLTSEQPLASVTVTWYGPAAKPPMLVVVAPFDHEYL